MLSRELQDLSASSIAARIVAVDKCGIQISKAYRLKLMANLCIVEASRASHPSS